MILCTWLFLIQPSFITIDMFSIHSSRMINLNLLLSGPIYPASFNSSSSSLTFFLPSLRRYLMLTISSFLRWSTKSSFSCCFNSPVKRYFVRNIKSQVGGNRSECFHLSFGALTHRTDCAWVDRTSNKEWDAAYLSNLGRPFLWRANLLCKDPKLDFEGWNALDPWDAHTKTPLYGGRSPPSLPHSWINSHFFR